MNAFLAYTIDCFTLRQNMQNSVSSPVALSTTKLRFSTQIAKRNSENPNQILL
jgi:hypothetical protein